MTSVQHLKTRCSSLPTMLVLVALLLASQSSLAGSLKKGKKKEGRKEPPKESQAGTESNSSLDGWLWDARLETRSLSSGRANAGRVFRSDEMPLTGPSWRFMDVVKDRKTNHGSIDLINLLIAGANTVAEKHPGSVLLVGNMGLPNGGKIVQSKSHQSGRDVDVAFYFLDRKGRQVQVGTFTHVRQDGSAGQGMRLDAERTWLFARTLLTSRRPAVQWMFASNSVRKVLLDHARQSGEPEWLVNLASEVIKQPSDSNPHDDHFHIRIHCSEYDLVVGCEEYGPQRSHLERDMRVVDEAVDHYWAQCSTGTTADRVEAIRRLSRVMSPRVPRLLETLLCSREPRLVDASATGLELLVPAEVQTVFLDHLGCASTPEARFRLFSPFSQRVNDKVMAAALTILEKDCIQDVEWTPQRTQLCRQATRAAAASASWKSALLLVEVLRKAPSELRDDVREALRILCVVDIPPGLIASNRDSDEYINKADKKSKKNPKKKGSEKDHVTKKSLKPSIEEEADAWGNYIKSIKGGSWLEHARKQLQDNGFLKDKPHNTNANCLLLLKAIKAGEPWSFAAQMVLSAELRIGLTKRLQGQDALDFWTPHIPKPPKKKPIKAEGKGTGSEGKGQSGSSKKDPAGQNEGKKKKAGDAVPKKPDTRKPDPEKPEPTGRPNVDDPGV